MFAGNGAYRGGGIFTQGGRLALTNTDFIGSSDGIYALGEYLTLDNVSISNSTSDAMTTTPAQGVGERAALASSL